MQKGIKRILLLFLAMFIQYSTAYAQELRVKPMLGAIMLLSLLFLPVMKVNMNLSFN